MLIALVIAAIVAAGAFKRQQLIEEQRTQNLGGATSSAPLVVSNPAGVIAGQ